MENIQINEKLINDLLKNDEELEKRAKKYDQNKNYVGFLEIKIEE